MVARSCIESPKTSQRCCAEIEKDRPGKLSNAAVGAVLAPRSRPASPIAPTV